MDNVEKVIDHSMIQQIRALRKELVIQAGQQMMVAARTAPKGKGVDIIEIALITEGDIKRLSDEMLKISEEKNLIFFVRDAENILQSDAVMILGTKMLSLGLNCAHCGFSTCDSKPTEVPCAMNTIDLGIAVGSACSKASDLRVDTRVMFSAGYAALRLEMLGKDCRCVMAIPISVSSKNPFFDRKAIDKAAT